MAQNDKQQRDLYESERNFRLLVEGVADCALYMLDPTGIVTSWNIGGQRIKGYAPEEILGRHFSRFYTETDRGNGKPARALTIAKEQGRYEEEGWRVRKDGTFFWASVVIDPIHEDGKLVGFAKITRDITERRDTQLKLEQMQNQLAESQKLDALGQLTGGVAHDFNNLLMVITGSIHTLKKGIGDDARMQRAVTAIETATRRGAALTSQLLTFARRQSVNPEPIDVAERIEAVRDVLDSGVGGAMTLSFDIDRTIWPVTVDVAELETALVNLVINARDAMPGGGRLTIETGNSVFDEKYCAMHTFARPGHYTMLAVTDTGTGMDAATLDRIFEPFFTTKETGKGTGLGLATVYGIVSQHDGFLQVYSEVNVGTTFRIYLPITPTAEKALLEEEDTGPVRGGVETILIAEDHEGLRELARETLTNLGYDILLANDGEEAVRVFQANRDRIDLLLLDVVLPKVNGPEAYARICAEKQDVPVIFATGYSPEMELLRSAQELGLTVVQKPYVPRELARRVRETLDRQPAKVRRG